MMARRTRGVATGERAKTTEPTSATGTVRAGNWPNSGPAIAAATATPRPQPNGKAMITAATTISQVGIGMRALRRRMNGVSARRPRASPTADWALLLRRRRHRACGRRAHRRGGRRLVIVDADADQDHHQNAGDNVDGFLRVGALAAP